MVLRMHRLDHPRLDHLRLDHLRLDHLRPDLSPAHRPAPGDPRARDRTVQTGCSRCSASAMAAEVAYQNLRSNLGVA